MAIHSNINEPKKTGIKIKIGEAFKMTPSNATAPAGGCRHRKNWPRAIANPTAIPLANEEFPMNITQRTAEIAPIRLPTIRFLGWDRGLFGAPNKRTVEVPNGAIKRE